MTVGGLVGSAMVRGYQLVIRPLLPSVCRFDPSCSEYARQAFAARGFIRGAALSVRRLSRCHPWSAGGYDPPPSAGGTRSVS